MVAHLEEIASDCGNGTPTSTDSTDNETETLDITDEGPEQAMSHTATEAMHAASDRALTW